MIRDKADQKQASRNDCLPDFRRFSARLAAALAAIASLAFVTPAFEKQDVIPAPPQTALPDVQVTRVRAHFESKTGPRTDIEIRWTALVPRRTKIEDFEVLLEARYTDGSKGVARLRHVKPSARAVLLSLATHPRQNNTAVLGDFKASVKVNF